MVDNDRRFVAIRLCRTLMLLKEQKQIMEDNDRCLAGDIKEPQSISTQNFVTSFYTIIKNHPLANGKLTIKLRYYAVLEYFIKNSSGDMTFYLQRLRQYRDILIGDKNYTALTEKNLNHIVKDVINNSLKPWRRKYRYWLFTDIVYILADKTVITNTLELMSNFISAKQLALLKGMLEMFFNDDPISTAYLFSEEQIQMFRKYYHYISCREERYLVTANMSAGKSTLINALVGKLTVRTSMEACTANLGYIYNKAFEDDTVHLFSTSNDSLKGISKNPLQKSCKCGIIKT